MGTELTQPGPHEPHAQPSPVMGMAGTPGHGADEGGVGVGDGDALPEPVKDAVGEAVGGVGDVDAVTAGTGVNEPLVIIKDHEKAKGPVALPPPSTMSVCQPAVRDPVRYDGGNGALKEGQVVASPSSFRPTRCSMRHAEVGHSRSSLPSRTQHQQQ
jgi:hypothetical protein